MSDLFQRHDRGERSDTRSREPAAPGRAPATARLFPGALLRKAKDARDERGVAEGADAAVAQAASSSGTPLPGGVRERFEASLGADLSSVRVHTGADSAAAASAVGARAYTVGRDIHFADGEYAPADPFGLHLLAHEVAHTQQQAGGSAAPQFKLAVSSSGDAAEVEADRAADAMVAGAAASVRGAAPAVQREEASESGGSQASFTLGDRTASYGVSKDGKTRTGQITREFPIKEFGPHQVCAEPPLFASFSISVKATGSDAAKSDDHGADESMTVGATLAVEASGKLLLGAAKEGLGKVGIEGGLTAAFSMPATVTIDKDGHLKLPTELAAPLTVEVTLALVGEVGKEDKKIGGALTKNLTSLKAGTLHVSDSGVSFEPCSMEAVGQAAKDLLWNTAETVLPGGQMIQQYEQDKKAQEEFDRNTAEQEKDAGRMESDPDEQAATIRGPAFTVMAPRETDWHDPGRPRIAAARAKADAAASPFNGARDASWWQGNAFASFNAGSVARMKARQLEQQFQAAEDSKAHVDALADQCVAAYEEAAARYADAQVAQYGKRVTD